MRMEMRSLLLGCAMGLAVISSAGATDLQDKAKSVNTTQNGVVELNVRAEGSGLTVFDTLRAALQSYDRCHLTSTAIPVATTHSKRYHGNGYVRAYPAVFTIDQRFIGLRERIHEHPITAATKNGNARTASLGTTAYGLTVTPRIQPSRLGSITRAGWGDSIG